MAGVSVGGSGQALTSLQTRSALPTALTQAAKVVVDCRRARRWTEVGRYNRVARQNNLSARAMNERTNC